MTVGQKIKQLRKERKWSQMYLGIETELSQTTIYDYEAGRTVPRLKTLALICKAFGVSIDEFMKGVEISW